MRAAPAQLPTRGPQASEHAPPAGGVIETPFGPLALDPNRRIAMPRGLPGFPEAEHFQLDHLPGVAGDLKLLQSVDTAELSFVVMPLAPESSFIAAEDLDQAREVLGVASTNLLVMLIVTLCPGDNGIEMFVNLRAPVLIDSVQRIGAQVVLPNPAYATRHPISPRT